jgi:hypothetical protein
MLLLVLISIQNIQQKNKYFDDCATCQEENLVTL